MKNMRERPIINNINTGPTMINYGFLPDTVPVSNLMERIAADKKWSREDIDNDIAILSKNRIVYVHDLRALSRESWTQIELLPLVKDLLRSIIDPEWYTNEKSGYAFNTNFNNDTITTTPTSIFEEAQKLRKEKKKSMDEGFIFGEVVDGKKKKKKDEKKKDKKKNKKKNHISQLGTPVIPTIFNGSLTTSPTSQEYSPRPNLQYNNNDTSSILSDTSSIQSQDHLTMQNTIRNGSINVSPLMPNAINTLSLSSLSFVATSSSSDNDDEIMSPTTLTRRKSVTFSEETAIGVAASEKTNASTLTEEEEKLRKKEKKKEKKNMKNKDNMASNTNNSSNSGYSNFTSHPYTTHPIVKFRKMKMKHSKRLPEVPPNDSFLQGIHDKLLLSQAEAKATAAAMPSSSSSSMDTEK